MSNNFFRNTLKNILNNHPKLKSYYKQDIDRLMTAKFRSLPDFIILGAQKSGTTSLYDLLCKHPQVLSAQKKEIQYFNTFYDYGLDWYRSHFPLKKKSKNGLFFITGEASPYYLFHPLVPERMFSLLPKIKLICLLRNPVDRAYSHYQHAVRVGKENLNFQSAINLENERISKERQDIVNLQCKSDFHFKFHSYLSRGLYAQQLTEWFTFFKREQFFIETTDNFKTNPKKFLSDLFQFLDISSFEIQDFTLLNKGNYSTIDKNTRKFLVEYFQPHNEQLYALLNRNFDWDK